MKDLFKENCKPLLKEIQEDANKWKNKVVYRSNTIPIKLSLTFFIELEISILSFIGNQRKPHIAKTILGKKNKAGGIRLLDIKQYYKATVSKAAWYGTKTDI